MRIRIGLIFTGVLIFASLCVTAMAGPDKSPSQICKANDDFGLSHDTCVVCIASGALQGIETPVCSCKILEDEGGLEAAGFENLGQCVSSGFQF